MTIIEIGRRVCRSAIFCVAASILFLSGVNPARAEESDPSAGAARYVFAVSWHPGFCETRPSRAECAAQSSGGAAARQFSLHGLWPLKQSYCGIADGLKAEYRKARWTDLPPVELSPDTAARLRDAMPGTVSGLDRQQWVRSGTCSGLSAERYFALSLAMLDRLNVSAVQALFAARIGASVSQDDVRGAFDAAFGKGAGERVRMRCRKDGARQVITGLTIGLSGLPGEGEDESVMGPLILAAGKTAFQCTSGVVDAAGPQ